MISYVSPRPDLPATFESLNDDSKRLILQFVGNKSYVTYAGINKHCKEIYLTTEGMTKETFLFGYAPLAAIKKKRLNFWTELMVGKGVVSYNRLDVLEWALEERKKSVLNEICVVAAGEGRIDILEEVLSYMNNESNKGYIFRDGDDYAARGGKLNVLKWYETKGLSMCKDWCAKKAAKNGHIQILQWLHEEKGLQLSGYMYDEAIDGGHLHAMKWLREQEVPWREYTFENAVKKGNLDILQWLHDEGCPWPEIIRAYEDVIFEEDVKPEVMDWCRVNGYGNRIL